MPARRPNRPAATGGVVRITEATGESPRSWDAAVGAAVKASEAKNVVGVEVLRMWAEWDGQKLSCYHATVKVAYRQKLKSPGR